MNNFPHEVERVVFVEFSKNGTPYQVFTRDGTTCRMYDIDFSRDRKGYLAQASGGGPPCLQDRDAKWWAPAGPAGDVEVVSRRTGRRLKGVKPLARNRLPDSYRVPVPGGKPFRIADLADNVDVVDRMVWCAECLDWYAAPDWGDRVCAHCSYCLECDNLNTPEERCKHDKRPVVPI